MKEHWLGAAAAAPHLVHSRFGKALAHRVHGNRGRTKTSVTWLGGLATALVLVSALLLLANSAYAEDKVFGVPISDVLISGTVEIPVFDQATGGREQRFVTRDFEIREGAIVLIETEDLLGGYKIGFSLKLERPLRGDLPHARAEIHPVTVERSPTGESSRRPSEEMRVVGFDQKVDMKAGGVPFRITLSNFEVRNFGDRAYLTGLRRLLADDGSLEDVDLELQDIYGPETPMLCCSACQGVIVCGGSVSDDCGGCGGGLRM